MRDFTDASIALPIPTVYHDSNDNMLLGKELDEYGNIIENYVLFVSRQTTYKESIWFTLVGFDKDKKNVVQVDFDDIPRKEFLKFLKDCVAMMKEELDAPEQ